MGHVVAWLAETLCYKAGVAGSILDEVFGSTQPLREMSTRNLPGCKGRPARKAGDLTAICEPIV
jgi:hypothetical protein